MTFKDLELSEELLRALTERDYEQPTPIQKQAIPYVLMNRDLLGCAQTGTGKTASFVLPMLDILEQGRARMRMPRSLILEPTRELAAQVAENFDLYGKYHNLTKALLIGGVTFNEQDKLLDRGVDVLIATPGRLMDHFERGNVLLNDVKILVIDEADRMLDMGFIPDVDKIVSKIPPMRQTLMFSATMPKEIKKLADRFLSNPKEVTVSPPSATADTVTQQFVKLSTRQKRSTLRSILEDDSVRNALIFCNRKRDVSEVHQTLERHGFQAGSLHGDMDQFSRTATLEKFKKDEIKYLVCSDVAARGLDIEAMSHVINFDVPTHAEDYVHRIGRTGRAGRQGHAITFVTSEERKYLDAVQDLAKGSISEIKLDTIQRKEIESTEEKSHQAHGRGKVRSKPKALETRSEKTNLPPTEAKFRHSDQTAIQKSEQKKSHKQSNEEVVGFGDDIPAFLMPATKA
ncbi:MAG: DNA helicase [Rhodospirillaceae bacterium]|nr:DNA helicase [Rhodospirillaceae bacterium]